MDKNLCDLPTEVLIQLFRYLTVQDLCRLRQICVRFNNIITSSMHIMVKQPDILVTNQHTETREVSKLCFAEKLRISHNWQAGRYEDNCYLHVRRKFMPWLVVSGDLVWFSRGKYVNAYDRKLLTQQNRTKLVHKVATRYGSDVSKFVVKRDTLVSGTRDGNVWMWSQRDEKLVFDKNVCPGWDVTAVDFDRSLYVNGSKSSLMVCDYNRDHAVVFYSNFHDRIWSTAFDDTGGRIFVGTAGNKAAPMFIIDLEGYACIPLGTDLQRGSGVFDIKWEDNNTVWTCGYDGHLRRWDLRTKQCAQSWEDPFESSMYCLDCDRVCTVVTGYQSYGRLTLWDTRKPSFVQSYYVEACKGSGNSSPVYSVGFDAKFLFAATDRCLSVLDFSVHRGTLRNYCNLFSKQYVSRFISSAVI